MENLDKVVFSDLFSVWTPDNLKFIMSYQTPSNSFYNVRYLTFYITETIVLNLTPELQTRFSRQCKFDSIVNLLPNTFINIGIRSKIDTNRH